MPSGIDVLLADGVIDGVLGRLMSGKEADISLVSQRGQVLAAKLYKDRATRSFKNNAAYKEGRKTRNTRTQRAMDGGGRFGRDAAEEAWKSAESAALSRLAAAGVRVPRPVMFYEGVLLMELVVDEEGRPAPRLVDVALDRPAASRIFFDLRRQMITMLCCDLIHGDLSPYNILIGAAGPTVIDFPQVVSAAHNNRAAHFFQRDFDNVLRFLQRSDPGLARHAGDGAAIWRAYAGRFLTPDFVPPTARPPAAPRPPAGGTRGRPAPPGRGRGPGTAPSRDRGAAPAPSRDRGAVPAPSRDREHARAPAPPRPAPRPSAPPPARASDGDARDRPRSHRRRPRRRG